MTRADRGRLALLGVVAMTLAGCATSRPKASKDTSFWSGRLALTVHSEPPQSYSASFELQGHADAGELALASPLGSTLAVMRWQPGLAVLVSGDEQRRFDSLEALASEVTGTPIPVRALFDWLSGRPTPVEGWQPDLSRLPEGRLTAQRTHPLPTAELRLVLER